jgi:hypothetical protein
VVFLSTGSAFLKSTVWTNEFGWRNDLRDHRELGDVNGDGRADVVGFKEGEGVLVGLSTN